jgi:hypothetical protein
LFAAALERLVPAFGLRVVVLALIWGIVLAAPAQ